MKRTPTPAHPQHEETEMKVLKSLTKKNLEAIKAQNLETLTLSKRVDELTRKLNNLLTKYTVLEKSNSHLHKSLFKTQDELESLQNTVFKNLYQEEPEYASDYSLDHDSPRHSDYIPPKSDDTADQWDDRGDTPDPP